MKRSYMIESIVYNCLSWDGLDTSGVPVEVIANDILTHIEKLGMQPPVCIKIKKISEVSNVDVKNSVLNFTTTQQVTTVSEWESEDEQENKKLISYDELKQKLDILRRYHFGDGSITREDILKVLAEE